MTSPAADPGRRPLVLVDTNALFLPFVTGTDLAAEVARWHEGARLAVPSPVRRELERLTRDGVPHAALAARLAATLPPVDAPGRGDAGILALAVRLRAAVVTADRELRDRLAAEGLTVLVPRDRGRLEPYRRRARAGTVKSRSPLARRSR